MGRLISGVYHTPGPARRSTQEEIQATLSQHVVAKRLKKVEQAAKSYADRLWNEINKKD